MSKQDAQAYVPSRYSKAFNTYSRSQLRWVVPILRSVALSCNIAFRFPVYKVLKAIAKIFLMNEIQAVFFAYMVRQTNWDIKDKLITQNSQQVRDVVCIANDQAEYKNLILYLMVTTYSVKFFLNDQQDIEKLLQEAARISPNFKLIFQNWAKKHSYLTKKISLKTLNRVYQELHFKIRHQSPDFNLLVDSILQISPAYNPQKNNDKKKVDKKQSKDPQPREALPREQPVKLVKTEDPGSLPIDPNPVFTESRLIDMVGVGLNVSEGSNFQVFGTMQKSGNIGTKFGNSVFNSSGFLAGGTANYNLKDDDYCEQLNLGLQEGESEVNINMRDAVPELPPTSILNLSKVNSLTQKFFNFKSEQ